MIFKLAEFIGFIFLIIISAYTGLVAHYRNELVSRRRALWGLAWIGLLLALDRLMLLLGVVNFEIVIGYAGIVVSIIIYWVVSEAKRKIK